MTSVRSTGLHFYGAGQIVVTKKTAHARSARMPRLWISVVVDRNRILLDNYYSVRPAGLRLQLVVVCAGMASAEASGTVRKVGLSTKKRSWCG